MEQELWLALTLFLSLVFLISSRLRGKGNLPPGPRGWPLVGNLFQLGSKPHATLANLARTHGPLFSLKLGTRRVVVASSPSTAALILKTHDHLLSARAAPQVSRFHEYASHTFIWSNCTDSWKKLKTICRSQLFSTKMLNDGANLRQQKVDEMVRCIRFNDGKETHIPKVVFGTIFSMLAGSIFSNDAEGATGSTSKMKRLIRRMVELSTAPNFSDYFPVIAGLDVQGLRREARACCKEAYEVWEAIILERKKHTSDETAKRNVDFLDVLLSTGFSDFQIKAFLLDLFAAGTDSTTTVIEWAMTELIRHPEIMAKLREELSSALIDIGINDSAMEQKLKELPYFQAFIKETFRLHPPSPLLPHCASEMCEVLGYAIPKDCQVWVNLWAIGRDPASWVEPLTFRPERFIDSLSQDVSGADHRVIPFGSGRRMCPGMPLATRSLGLILAALVHNFEWSLPHGMDPSQLSMEEKFSLTIPREQPLQLIPKFIGHY